MGAIMAIVKNLLTAIGVVVLLSQTAAFAVEGTDGAQRRHPITIYTKAASTGQNDGSAQDLLRIAREAGRIRVIIGLNMSMKMEHTLSRQQAEAQAAVLRSMQRRVADRVLGSSEAQKEDRFDFIPYMSMFVTPAQLGRLVGDPDVVSIQEDVQDEPLLAQSTTLVHARDLWLKSILGTGQTMAVLDTGVDKSHPMFAGKVVSEACYSTTDAATNMASVCPGGVPATTAPGSGVHCSTAWKGCDHGTHVAGITLGKTAGKFGMAPNSRLIAVQVFSRKTTTNVVTSFQTDQIKGLQRVYALRNTFKIAAVNMSLGGGFYSAACDAAFPAITTAISNLRSAGIATIIASGNNGYNGYISRPACVSTAVAVGNTTKSDLVWRSSNHSSLLKLVAPGTAINSSVPGGTYASKTGTSMAAPHVAGAFGQLRHAKSAATVDEMLEALTCTGKTIDKRFVSGGTPTAVSPPVPRIDMIGAYNYLLNPPVVARSWPFTSAWEYFDWSIIRGGWRVAGGNLVQTPRLSGWAGTKVSNCNTKVQISARLRRIDPDTSQYWNSGILFKVKTDLFNSRVSGYWVAYNDCPTRSDGVCTGDPTDPRGQAVFWVVTDLDLDSGFASAASLKCTKGIPIAPSGYNTIRVVSNGTTHVYYLNGKLVCAVTDGSYTSGDVVLQAAFPSDTTGQYLAYDHVAITAYQASTTSMADVLAEAGAMTPASLAPAATPSNMSIRGSTKPSATTN